MKFTLGKIATSWASTVIQLFQIVNCECTEAWTGNNCADDRDDCLIGGCFPGVECTDVTAPGVGVTCGPCPEFTTGNHFIIHLYYRIEFTHYKVYYLCPL